MNKDKVFARRLLKLADYLRTDKVVKQFNFGKFVDSAKWKGKQDLSCGAPACAIGHAASMPAFRRLGLCLARDNYNPNGHVYAVLKSMLATSNRLYMNQTVYSIREIFGTDEEEFYFLFVPLEEIDYDERNDQSALYGCESLPRNATSKQVANRIRFFVNHKYGKQSK